MIKNIFICFIFIFLFSNAAFCDSQYVTALENKLFGISYPNENYSQRVDRIEREIYGKNYIGNSEERLEKIYKIYPKEELLNINNYNQQTYDYSEDEYKEAENNDYPMVTLIEEKTLSKSYAHEDIYKRLDRLEEKLYGKIYNELSLNERVEKLKQQSKISNKPQNFQERNSYYIPQNDSSMYGSTNSRISNILQEMELETFSHTYPDNSDNDRIRRLEQFYFGAYQDNLSEKQRLTKLAKMITKNNNYGYDYGEMRKMERNAQWAELIMNLLIIGLGLIL